MRKVAPRSAGTKVRAPPNAITRRWAMARPRPVPPLLRLEEALLLSGSLLLFVVLSAAMWLTRNLHRPQPIPSLAPQAQE